jgi:hypothetical protein
MFHKLSWKQMKLNSSEIQKQLAKLQVMKILRNA